MGTNFQIESRTGRDHQVYDDDNIRQVLYSTKILLYCLFTYFFLLFLSRLQVASL